MAHHKSAVKRIRQTKKRTLRNKVQKTKTRGIIKKVREAIANKDKGAAQELLVKAQSQLAKLTSKGAMKPNTSSRTTARLTKQVNGL
ncbi:MAG: 30S ribosomal protein S20 [Bacteriovoracaceae bacterium]